MSKKKKHSDEIEVKIEDLSQETVTDDKSKKVEINTEEKTVEQNRTDKNKGSEGKKDLEDKKDPEDKKNLEDKKESEHKKESKKKETDKPNVTKESVDEDKVNTSEMTNKDYQIMYDKLLDYEKKLHAQNQRRIRIGIKCIYIIPIIFLFLLFVTGSSKIIFLILWIASLFGIAIYLIIVEYIDYNLQEKMMEIQGKENAQVESLIDIEEVEGRVNSVVKMREARRGKDK